LSLGAAAELLSWAIATPAVRASANSIARIFFMSELSFEVMT